MADLFLTHISIADEFGPVGNQIRASVQGQGEFVDESVVDAIQNLLAQLPDLEKYITVKDFEV